MSFFKDFIYLFLDRGVGREKERERNINVWLPLVHSRGPGPQPRHVPWLGIEPATLWFAGRHSINWATQARAACYIFVYLSDYFFGAHFSSTYTKIGTIQRRLAWPMRKDDYFFGRNIYSTSSVGECLFTHALFSIGSHLFYFLTISEAKHAFYCSAHYTSTMSFLLSLSCPPTSRASAPCDFSIGGDYFCIQLSFWFCLMIRISQIDD